MSELTDRINEFGDKKRQAELEDKRFHEMMVGNLTREVKELAPRIAFLVDVGNACIANGIPITGRADSFHESYDTHQFVTNSWSHLTGLWQRLDTSEITGLGIRGGGLSDFNLMVRPDGSIGMLTGEKEYVLTKFINDFDRFEQEFTSYVNSVIG